MTLRKRRKYFKLSDIEQFHGVTPGTCLRCKVVCRAEKAHVIDFAWGGADCISNIVPLCAMCHHRSSPSDKGVSNTTRMPIFVPGEEWKAQMWLQSTSWDEYIFNLAWYAEMFPELVPNTQKPVSKDVHNG